MIMELLNYRIFSSDGTISFVKPVLVFLHGFGGSSAIWMKQVNDLKEKYDLLMIDLPSHGKSKVMLSQMDKTFEAVANKIIEVLNYLNIKKANFIGCSLGTMFVKYIVLKKQELVDKYVLIGSIGMYSDWFKCALQAAKMLLYIMPRKWCCNLVAKLIIPHKKSIESRKIFLQCAKRIPKKEFICWLKLLVKFPRVNKEYINMLDTMEKGLYITGDRDVMFIDSLVEEYDKINNKVILNDCGHVCNIDKYKEVNQLVKNFI